MRTVFSNGLCAGLCGGLVLSAVGSVGWVSEAQAATVTVTTTSGGNPSGCGLQEAVAALNAGVSQNGCTLSGSGPNTINLQTGVRTYTITNRLAPTVDMTIVGESMTNTTIQVSGGSFPANSMVLVETPGTSFPRFVTFKNLSLRRNPSNPPPNVTGIEIQGYWDEVTDTPGPTVTLLNSRVSNFDHSGIYSAYGWLELADTIIEDNSSLDDGGGIYLFADNGSNRGIRADRCLFRNNHAGWSGGAIYFYAGGTSHIRSSTLSNNDAYSGGGVFAFTAGESSYFQLNQVTIAENEAFTGGGIYSAQSVGDSRVSIFGSIVANNTGAAGWDLDGYVNSDSTLWSSTDDLDLAMHGSEDLLDVDPLLGPLMALAGNGIPVYPLLAGSPAIEQAGTTIFADFDQRGFPLTMDGTGASGSGLNDMGAYEHGPWQSELLAMVAKSSGDAHSTVNDWQYSNGKGTRLAANAVNDFVTYRLPVFETGTYSARIRVMRMPNGGQAKLQVSTSQSGPWTDVGASQNFYAAGADFPEFTLTNSLALGSTGTRYFRFLVTGKSPISTGYAINVDYIKLVKL